MNDTSLDGAPMPDSALMGDPMDDLFGDGTDALGGTIALPPIPLPAPLVARVAELQRNGCRTRLAWSNTGSIAQISRDGSKIAFRAMERHPRSGKWSLSRAASSPLIAPEGRRFVHIECNKMGIDLAAIDDFGGVHMYTLTSTLSRMQPSQVEISSRPHTDVDAVVGFHWLPLSQEYRAPYITKAVKAGDKWVSGIRTRDANAPKVNHPAENRNALLYVTRGSRLTLLYQNEVGSWLSVSTELETFESTQQFISHAAMGEDGDHILLATHDETTRLRTYHININWNAQPQQRNGVNLVVVAPAIDVGHLAVLDAVAPQLSDTALLSHLKVLTPSSENQGLSIPLGPTIFAVFTHVVSPVSTSQQLQDSFSAVARWRVEKQTPTLHDGFAKLKKNGQIPSQLSVTRLIRQPDIITSKTILTMDSQYWNTILALGASDGTIEFRDALTGDILGLGFGRTEEVSSLPDAGFEQSPTDHHPLIALSSDGSFIASARADDKVEVKPMTLRYGWEPLDDGISDGKATVEAAVVCLARQYAYLSYSSMASDDPLALLPQDLSQEFRSLFFKEVIRMTNARPDVGMVETSKQQITVLRDPFVHRALSAQLILGLKPGTSERYFPAQFAYITLHLKLSGTAIVQSLGQKAHDLGRLDTHPSLVGNVRWAMDLMVYILDQVLQVKELIKDGTTHKQALEEFAGRTQSSAVHLLLCSFSRAMLKCHVSYIQPFLRMAQAAIPRMPSVADRQQLIGAVEAAKAMPFTLQTFHELLQEVDAAVRETYVRLGNTPEAAERRMRIELSLMTSTALPEEMSSALQTLMDKAAAKLADSANIGKLRFCDTSWLQISRSIPRDDEPRYDAIKKTPLIHGMRVRTCRRCGAEMEDIPQEQLRQIPPWLVHAQRHCYCLSYWWMA